ncbi:hypothetical protein NQ315_015925 [Exocentrus adspersus]|uniref:C2H2-type domain-containing protein n=1 Tax=Exocentrus adspersus TaxID=1586481 RepID=A0AAV8V7U3_9CUCU|nr:hypothetical protein NQ315_015925 [Exocentrus adspersus]
MNRCTECHIHFSKTSNLTAHVKRKHPDKLEEIAPIKKKFHICPFCSENFQTLQHLVSHKKTHLAKLKCSVCPYTGYDRENLILHYRSHHFFSIENECLKFDTFEDFQTWKSKVETETYSSFVKMYGSKKATNCTTINYNCHRSGLYKKKGINIRKLKTQGTNKIGGYCPARMNIKIMEDKTCVVNFCRSHIGHKQEQDLGHLFLSKFQKQNVAAKIAAKIPFQVILDEVRDSVSNSHLERLHLLTKKDLYNLEQCFNLSGSSVRHTNDAISVDAWVNGQKDLLLRFGEDCITIDGTHGLNAYGFELHTILVLDDLREGYPTAFLISNRSDSTAMSIFFQCIKERIGKGIKPKVFMSDMADVYYKSWVQVMQPAEFRLFCTWHIEVYHMLRTLLQETDSSAFNKLLSNTVEYFKEDADTLEFGTYFEQYYACKPEQWAYCFRLHCGLNTNMHIERMHRTIKHLYLHGKFVKRLDKAIGAIMKFVKDKLFERIIVLHKGKVSTKISELRNRHIASLSLDLNRVIKTDTGWLVPSSSSNEIYTIEEVKESCPCKLVCEECQACLHRFTCTCLDSCIKWNMCKHIHLVCKYTQLHANNDNTNTNKENVLSTDKPLHKHTV